MDWKTLIAELLASGMTQQAIGAEVGLSQGAISHLVNGRTASVGWETGEKLIRLHVQRISCAGSPTTA